MIHVPTLTGSVQITVVCLSGGKICTQRGKAHEAGNGDSPEVFGVDDVATVDLRVEQVLDTRARQARYRTENSPEDHPLANCSS